MQKLSSFGQEKKFRPKKSLTSLLHAALQLHLKRKFRPPIFLKKWFGIVDQFFSPVAKSSDPSKSQGFKHDINVGHT